MTEKHTVENEKNESTLPQEPVSGGVYDNPLSDAGFKKLLASAKSLTNFLNSVMHLDKEREIASLKFKTKRITYQSEDAEGGEKETWCFDIRAQTRDGRAVDIEVQNRCHHFFSDRVLTYGSALMLKAKAELDKSREEETKKMLAGREPPVLTAEEKRDIRSRAYELPETVCVWVCNFPVPETSTETWDDWMLYSGNELKKGCLLPISDRIKYIFLQLPNFNKGADELSTDEDQWIYVLKHAFASAAEFDIKNDAVTEALERLKSSEKDEDKPVMTKKERDCIIASLEIDAEKAHKQVERLENVVAEKDAENASLAAEVAALKAQLAALAAK